MSTDDVFDRLEAALAARGFTRTFDEVSSSFGSRQRGFARGIEALRLTFDGRDGFLALEGGAPWRDLLVLRPSAEQTPEATVTELLAGLADAEQASRPAG